MNYIKHALALGITVALTACGGGGSSSDSSSSTPTGSSSTPTGSTTPTDSTTPSGSTPVAASQAYVGGRSILQYAIGVSGALTTASTPIITGSRTNDLKIDPSGKYAYAISPDNTTVYEFSVTANGGLVPLSPASVTIGTGTAFKISIDSTGKYLYVVNRGSNNTVSEFAIGTNGILTSIATLTLPASSPADEMSIASSGSYVYVLNATQTPSTSSITQYSIGATGVLSLSPVNTVATPYANNLTIGPTGKYAYTTGFQVTGATGTADITTGDAVKVYGIGTNGVLTLNSTMNITVNSEPSAITIDPTNKYAYVTNNESNTVSQFTIGSNGSLSSMSTPTVASSAGPFVITVDPTSKYTYVGNTNGGITQYTIGSNGALTQASTLSTSAGEIDFITLH